MTFSFTVRTQHERGPRFIVPIEVEAESAIDAARDRFSRQCGSSRRGTTALLVTGGLHSDAVVFPVREVITTAFEVDEHAMSVLQEVTSRG